MDKYSNHELKVYMILKNKKKGLLLLNHTDKGNLIYGYVNPPAGHVEPGETINQTIRREVKEEMGIKKLDNIELKGLVDVYGFKDHPVLMFIMSAEVPDSEKPKTHDEGEPVFIKPKDLPKHKMLSDVKKIVNLALTTPKGKIFEAVSKFKNYKLLSFKIYK